MIDPRSKQALVAGDDDLVRLALVTILTRFIGFAEVLEATSLDEALEALGDGQDIELAIFDLAMPGMESPAAVGAVRERGPGAKLVVVSTSVARRDILAALEAGAHGYLSRRLGTAEFARALQLVLSGSLYVPPTLAELPNPSLDAAAPASEERSFSTYGTGSDRFGTGRREHAFSTLTARQREVLGLLVEGRSNKDIARALVLTEGTVKIHVATLLRALGVANRAAAAVAGARFLDRGEDT